MPNTFDLHNLFTDALSAKPYSLRYEMSSDGWSDHCDTAIIEEAKGIGLICYESTVVHNSHGTDCTHSTDYSKELSLGELAAKIEKSKADSECRKDHVYQSKATPYIQSLREADAAFNRVFEAGKAFFAEYLPEWTLIKLLYASTSTVFSAVTPTGEACALKLTPISACNRDATDTQYEQLLQLKDTKHLLPIWGKKWLPLDETHELLLTWSPLMETFRTIRNRYYGLHYSSSLYPQLHDCLPFDDCIEMATQLAEALHTLHKNGLVHHDVKPENLFFARSGKSTTWYLGDFDSIKPVQTQYAGKNSYTLAFAAPEVRAKEPYSFSCDVYSWGYTIFFLLSGKHPEEANPSSPYQSLWDYLPPRKDELLMFILAIAAHKLPNKRYSNGKELLEALSMLNKPTATTLQSLFVAAKCTRKSGILKTYVAIFEALADGLWGITQRDIISSKDCLKDISSMLQTLSIPQVEADLYHRNLQIAVDPPEAIRTLCESHAATDSADALSLQIAIFKRYLPALKAEQTRISALKEEIITYYREIKEKHALFIRYNPEERATLENEKKALNVQIAELEDKIQEANNRIMTQIHQLQEQAKQQLPEEKALEDQRRVVSALSAKRENLSFFQFREKRALDAQICEDGAKLRLLITAAREARKAFDASITGQFPALTQEITPLRKEKSELEARLQEINRRLLQGK